jgi:hypothetical protein
VTGPWSCGPTTARGRSASGRPPTPRPATSAWTSSAGAYTSTDVPVRADGSYAAKVDPPPTGYTAYFLELTYDSGGPFPYKFTTEVVVTPDKLPFKWEDAVKRYPPKTP